MPVTFTNTNNPVITNSVDVDVAATNTNNDNDQLTQDTQNTNNNSNGKRRKREISLLSRPFTRQRRKTQLKLYVS